MIDKKLDDPIMDKTCIFLDRRCVKAEAKPSSEKNWSRVRDRQRRPTPSPHGFALVHETSPVPRAAFISLSTGLADWIFSLEYPLSILPFPDDSALLHELSS